MKNLSKLALLALIVAASVEACTKGNSASPKTNATTTTATSSNKAASGMTLLKRDTITPIKNVAPFKRDTITPIKVIITNPLIKRDTITPNY